MTATVRQNPIFAYHRTAQGGYWKAAADSSALRDLARSFSRTIITGKAEPAFTKAATDQEALRAVLRGMATTTFKTASIGGEQESGFEQAFSSLAYAYLKDKAPRLLDFIVGFQLVDRNEDNTKAMGVFGFKVGDMWLYAPVFFLSGDLKGHELLYIKKQDMFVPMKENWVNHLISNKPYMLGEGSEKNTHQLGGMMPNLQTFTRPPYAKYGVDDWAAPFVAFTAAAATSPARVLSKHAGLWERLDLGKFLDSFSLVKAAFDHGYLSYPLVKQGFDRFYGIHFFQKKAEQIKADGQNLVKQADSFLVPPPRKRRRPSPLLIPEEQDREENWKKTAVEVVISDEDTLTENLPELDEEERERLLRDQVLIMDHRDGERVSKAYNTQVRMELQNPTETGVYDVLEKPGTFGRVLVVAHPHTNKGRENFSVIIRVDGESKDWLNIHPINVWTKPCDCPVREDFKTWWDGLADTQDLKVDGLYLAIGANGAGTTPFRVRESYGEHSYKVDFKDYCSYQNDRPRWMPMFRREYDSDGDYISSYNAKLFINQRDGVGLRAVKGELSVPKSFKIFTLAEPKKKDEDDDKDSLISCCSCPQIEDGEGSEERPIQPGNLADIQLMINEKTAQLKLIDTGAGEMWIKSRLGNERMSKKAALVALVRDHGLAEAEARILLKEAAVAQRTGRSAAYRVKYAEGYPGMQPGPTAPPIPEPPYGSDQAGPNSWPAIYPQEEFLPVSDMDSHQTDPSIYDPFYQPDQQAMQVAQSAASKGQKEVFDTAMIGGMLKSVRQDTLVERYLGDLMKALDKLARILFMFYWHQEEFEDRYGKQDLPELEDSLRNSFEALGDVVLYLKEKSVRSGMEMSGAGVGSAASQGEPSIEEAARN